MSIIPLQRLISNTSTVYLGTDIEAAAVNAANSIGTNPSSVTRFNTWPSIEKFDNDDTTPPPDYSPFSDVPNPDIVWETPTTAGQSIALAIASDPFTLTASLPFNLSLTAFCDNAMEMKIELFVLDNGDYIKVEPQPLGLGDVLFVAGDSNNPAVGITELEPFNWQDIRIYSTSFAAPIGTFKIVLSFEATNYLPTNNNPMALNPAGLQFVLDIYSETLELLYITNFLNNTGEIYNVTIPSVPGLAGEFNNDNLSAPTGMAIAGNFLYVANNAGNTVAIYNISNPVAPVFEDSFNGGNLDSPTAIAISGTILYVANSNNNTGAIYDISTPTAPNFVGTFNGGNLNNPGGMAIAGNTLYVTNTGSDTVSIYDITNPISPTFVNTFNGGNLSSPSGIAISGDYLYITNTNDHTVEIYDISTPTAPTHAGELNDGQLNVPFGAATGGTTLYITSFLDNGVDIYDISDPTNPVRIGEITTGILDGPYGAVILTNPQT